MGGPYCGTGRFTAAVTPTVPDGIDASEATATVAVPVH
jgi:hypothetical protein